MFALILDALVKGAWSRAADSDRSSIIRPLAAIADPVIRDIRITSPALERGATPFT